MAVKQLNPYLNFGGTAAKAIALYESALGAKTLMRSTFGQAHGGDTNPDVANRIMHATLQIGGGTLMISDGPPDYPVAAESNTHVCLDFDDPADLEQKFNALAKGGQVTMPLQDTFWGAKFGMLTDEYNIRWMFNCELKKG